MSNPFLYKWIILFETTQLSMNTQFVKNISISSYSVLIQKLQFSISIVFVHTELNIKTVLFQVIQFIISTQFSSIWPINRTLSDATTLGQSRSGSDGSKWILHIPQSSRITGTSPLDCLVSYSEHSLGGWGSGLSAEMQSVYSIAPADWANLL